MTSNTSPRNSQTRRARHNYRVWNALLSPLVPALGAYTLWRRYGQKKSAASLRGQWGNVPDEVVRALQNDLSSTRIWIHAVSVGETLASRPVARALRQEIPNCVIVLSTTTDAGQETARAAHRAGDVDAVFYFPLDIPFSVNRVLKAVRPHAFLTMETELWPNFLHLAKSSGAQTFLVNGRVSDNLLRRAPKMGHLWRWMMSNLDGLLMRTESDAARIGSLGAQKSRVFVTGDVKLDAMNEIENLGELRAHWRRVLDVADDVPFVVAGSTHAGEDEQIVAAFQTLRRDFPDARLLVAPRHIERAPEVVQAIGAAGLQARLRSANASESSAVIILDSVGELSQIYAAADVAFVGGSLITRGGHNVLEPVLCDVPVAFGPHIDNFRDAAALVERAEVGQKVDDAKQLAELWARWLRDENWRKNVAARAENVLREHRGASLRVAQIVAQSLRESDIEYSNVAATSVEMSKEATL